MLDGGVSRRYARALFDVAVGLGTVDAVEDSLAAAVTLLHDDPDTWRFWIAKSVQPEEKHRVIETAFKGSQSSQQLINFLKLVVDKAREHSLPGMLLEYKRLADEYKRVQDIDLTTALPLSDPTLLKLEQKLEAYTGHKVRMNIKVDPSLVGGIVVRIGDKVLDGSVATRLKGLQRALSSGV